MDTDYIKMDELKPFGLYRILARNASVGIWVPEQQGFLIIRHKFGDWFDFIELHCDADPNFGTAIPEELLEETSFTESDFEGITVKMGKYDVWQRRGRKALMSYLKQKMDEYTGD